MFVGHKQLGLLGQEALNAKHPQPPNHKLFKVALRALIPYAFSRLKMNKKNHPKDCIIPNGVTIGSNVIMGSRVIFADTNIIVLSDARLDAGCIIGAGVTIGYGAWVRAGSVVLNSIPPNSIVEGNPAMVVGYIQTSGYMKRSDPRLIHSGNFDHINRPACVPLGVGNSAIYLMRRITDGRGSLTVGEVPTEVPFSPARYFLVFDAPSVELRGEHAHKHCQQFLICTHGSCRVLLDDGEERCEVLLDRPDMGVFMPEMVWGTQYRFSADSVLLVFASRTYEPEDYLRTYDEFMMARKNIKSL